MRNVIRVAVLAAGVFASTLALGETARIAVAANFTKTIEALGQAFEAQSGHQVKFAFGPTGKLYAQIKNGAPFDAFFGADERRPKKTIEDGLGLADTYSVYAQGQIVLYSDKLPVESRPLEVLKAANFNHLAVANPKTAPYGERAVAYLKSQGLYRRLKPKIVNGESIAHAFQYVATKNAEIGFVALSQVVDPQSPLYRKGQYWVVPQTDYQPINQGALVLKRGADNEAVREFMKFIKTPQAIKIIKEFGYNVR